MMRFLSRLGKAEASLSGTNGAVAYESMVGINSKAVPGVKFVLNRVSFGRRMELSKRVLEISQRAGFLEAGNRIQEKIEASILAQQIDALYLAWGLVSVDGLKIDGEAPTTSQLIEKGPEELTREIVSMIKAQCGLSEVERKN